jgi:dihydropteroate synthase
VAKASIESGAAIINDISAGNLDDKMFEIIANITFHYDAHAWQSANDANIDKL